MEVFAQQFLNSGVKRVRITYLFPSVIKFIMLIPRDLPSQGSGSASGFAVYIYLDDLANWYGNALFNLNPYVAGG